MPKKDEDSNYVVLYFLLIVGGTKRKFLKT